MLTVLALVVALAEGLPVLHRESRTGLQGRPFTILKFRSLRTSDGPGVAADGDERITRLGRFLRRWRLDELPQLVNVLRGEMSLVGPRPMLPAHVAAIPAEDAEIILSVRPGITGVSALAYIGDDAALGLAEDPESAYLEFVLPQKIETERQYLRDWSLGRDFGLLAKTFSVLASRRARSRSAERVRELIVRSRKRRQG